jgi:glycerol-3-phosphate acyltransferase PlsY
MAFLFKISSLSALTAACLTPLFAWYWEQQPAFTAMAIIMCGLLIWRHRSNIKNLLSGTEGKIRG